MYTIEELARELGANESEVRELLREIGVSPDKSSYSKDILNKLRAKFVTPRITQRNDRSKEDDGPDLI